MIHRRACRYCGSPARGNPCWRAIKLPNWIGDPPCVVYPETKQIPKAIKIMVSIIFWIYLAGFAAIFAINICVGPVTLGLALLRALVWPIWWLTGLPHGAPMTMD